MNEHLMDEELISLAGAVEEHIPGRPHISSIHRWRGRGIRGVKLECVRVGGRWFTSREAIRRFLARTTSAAMEEPSSTSEQTGPGGESRRVEAELDQAGL